MLDTPPTTSCEPGQLKTTTSCGLSEFQLSEDNVANNPAGTQGTQGLSQEQGIALLDTLLDFGQGVIETVVDVDQGSQTVTTNQGNTYTLQEALAIAQMQQQPQPTNWAPWVVGGGLGLVVILLLVRR